MFLCVAAASLEIELFRRSRCQSYFILYTLIMAKSRTQNKIEDFLKEFSLLAQKYGMLIDANGNQSEGTPLALYATTGKTSKYKKVGCLYYSFEGPTEAPIYNFDPKNYALFEPVKLEIKDLNNDINLPAGLLGEIQVPEDAPQQEPPKGLLDAIEGAKFWESKNLDGGKASG